MATEGRLNLWGRPLILPPSNPKKVEHATAVIWKTLLIAEQSFRRLDAPERLPEVAEGVVYVDGVREKRGNAKAAA